MKKVMTTIAAGLLVLLAVSCASVGTGKRASAANLPPLYQSVLDGDFPKVQKLVEAGAKIDEGTFGFTPLEAAAEKGNLEMVEYLLKKGAHSVSRAFEKAMLAKKTNVTKFLVDENYISVNDTAKFYRSYLTDKNVDFDKRMETVKKLTDGKLNSPYLLSMVENENYEKMIRYFSINLADRANSLGGSLLHVAAQGNNNDLVDFLLSKKFDVNALDDNHQTALFYAITVYGPSVDWTNPITENDSNARINFVSDMPYYANPQAVQQKQVQLVSTLLDAGVNLNVQNKQGWSVLHFAAAFYPRGLRELLISQGADAKLLTNLGRTADDVLRLR